MRVLSASSFLLAAAVALVAAPSSAVAKPISNPNKVKPAPLQSDNLVAPDYTAKKVKAFSIRLPGWGFMADNHNDPIRRLAEAKQEERELAPVEYVRYRNTAIVDVNPGGGIYGSAGSGQFLPYYQLGLVFGDSQQNARGVPNNGVIYNVASLGANTAGIVSGVNGPDWPQPKFAFKSVQHVNVSDDLIITFTYKTRGWNPYYAIVPPTNAPSPSP